MSFDHKNYLGLKNLLAILFCALATGIWAQDLESLRASGQANLQSGQYRTALGSYLSYQKAQPGDGDILTGIGICYFELGQLENASEYFSEALKQKTVPLDALRYLGKLAHAQLLFEEAAEQYKRFLKAANADHPLRAAVKDDILRCANGIQVRRQEPQAAVVELGEPINSAGDEFRPLFSPKNPNRLYFAYSRPKTEGLENVHSDLCFSDLVDGDWLQPKPLSVFLNSTANEVPQGFDEQGQLLYFFRGETLFSGDILVDTLRENPVEGILFFPELVSPARAWEGDRDLFFFNDTILLFASRRAGGYGGLDLYVCTRHTDGWSAPENLGPDINSAYDEASPFLAHDGRTLYFSTNDARRSIGGFDLMRSVYLDRLRKWIPAENLGLPFNSADDDEHFLITPDGQRAFFSSARKQGQGQRDLYLGIFEKTKTEQLARSEPVAFHFVVPQAAAAPPGQVPPASANMNTVLHLSQLRYLGPNLPLTEDSFAKLTEIARWMKDYPELRVTFAAHTAEPDGPHAGSSALQQVLEALQAKDIPMANLALRNLGTAFPFSGNGSPDDQRRIDVLVANPEVLPLPVQLPELPASRAKFFQQAMGRIVFQVVVRIEPGDSPGELFARYPQGTLLSLPASGHFFFTYGIYLTWDSARQVQDDLRSNGFPTATALPFRSGWALTKEEAAGLVEQFPELEGFVGF